LRLTEDPPPPRVARAWLDPRWNDVILRLLARDPAARFATAAEAVAALVAPPRIWTRGRIVVGASIALAALGVLGALRWVHATKPVTPPPSSRKGLRQTRRSDARRSPSCR